MLRRPPRFSRVCQDEMTEQDFMIIVDSELFVPYAMMERESIVFHISKNQGDFYHNSTTQVFEFG